MKTKGSETKEATQTSTNATPNEYPNIAFLALI